MCQGGKPDTGKLHASYMYVVPPIGDLGDITGIEGQSGKDMCQGGGKPDTGKLYTLILYCYECMRLRL